MITPISHASTVPKRTLEYFLRAGDRKVTGFFVPVIRAIEHNRNNEHRREWDREESLPLQTITIYLLIVINILR